MTEQLLIRPVLREDFPAWKILWDGYNAFYGRHGETALPDAVTQMTWSRFFDAYEPMHALVAESEGHVLGLVHFIFHRTTIHTWPDLLSARLVHLRSRTGQGSRSRFD